MKKVISLIKNELLQIIFGASLFAASIIVEALKLPVLATILYIITLIVCGFRVFLDAVRGILRLDLLDERFLMTIASVGAMIIGEYTEGVAVMLFFLVGEYFEHKAVRRSRASIKALMDINPDEATVLRDREELRVDSDEVEVGDILIIRPGERVAVDCVVISGESDVDTSSMTGESTPVPVFPDFELQSGVVVINGTLFCKALRPAEESSATRVLSLVEEATERKSREESFITVFSRYYTPIVVILAVLMATIPSIFKILSFSDALYRALIFLVISCPCALVISVPMSFFGGIGAAASRGILFKGGNVFSGAARADAIAFDKTGTLTEGNLSVQDVIAIDTDKEEVLRLAASAEYGSNHPVAKAITLGRDLIVPEKITEIAGKGIVATVNGEQIAVGNIALMKHLEVVVSRELDGVYVSRGGKHIGNILLSDTVKGEAAEAVSELSRIGVKHSYVLSGDRKEKVEAVAFKVGIKNCTSEMSPEDKFHALEGIIEKSSATIYVGDGINDSPSLARADVGIAMGALGADSAIEAADVVIMSDNLKRIPEAVRIARKTLRIAKQNIFFAISVKLLVMILGAFSLADMCLAVFADVGVAILAILNAMRILRFGKRRGV
ncbi:MAG: cadmium-translocating P-type ATPase [Clostridia bacterium]|nr:cadmium-translocating P-type ATPase [Clostridia bacterium]